MSIQRLAIGAIALLGIVIASAAPPTGGLTRSGAPAAGAAHLMAFGGRSAEQMASGIGGKLDAALADLARHAARVRPGHELEDLHSMSPAAHFAQRGAGAPALVAVDAVTRGDPQRLKALLVGLGLEHPSVYSNDVGGWLPVSAIETAAAHAEVHSIRAALWHTRAVVATQGDFAQGSSRIRSTWPVLNGSGITVGVMSDSYNCYSVYAARGLPATGPGGYATENGITTNALQDVASGALPAGVNVLKEGGQGSTQGTCLDYNQQGFPAYFLPYADEGRAMMQVVHAVAPAASLAFYTAAESEADFANGIGALAAAGARVEVDDIGYFDEPFFQDGIVAQAIDKAQASGVAYFSAAGNNGTLAYDNDAPSFATASTTPPGEELLNFDNTKATTTTALPVTIPALMPGEFLAVVVEWDQPYVTGAPGSPGASSRIDLCVSGAGSLTVLNPGNMTVTCTGPNGVGTDPVQVLVLGNPATSTANTAVTPVTFTVGLVNGSPAPGRIKLAVEDDGAGSQITSFATNSPILQGHPGAAGAAAVGAAFFANTTPCGAAAAVLDSYSSAGGAPLLFDSNNAGKPLAPAIVRQKPDFVGPDGVNTTFFGFPPPIKDNSPVPQCAANASYPNYFGTSAAAPHAAAAAALMLQANSAITPAEIYVAMQKSAAAMGTTTPNFDSGYGFIQASAALALLPPAAPTLSIAPTSITAGSSATLTWNSINTTGCAASWAANEPVSGSQTVTPTTPGNVTYTLTCSNAAGSAASSVNLMVQPAPSGSGGGGGGGLDGVVLLALSALACRRSQRAARGPGTQAPG